MNDRSEEDEFGAMVGGSYGLAEAQMGRELYEANIVNAAGVAEYWKAKATFWNMISAALVVTTFLGLVAGMTGIVKWWVS